MSNISFPDGSALVSLTASVWTARAKLTRDDLDPAAVQALPPETLASLGSKRLIDPALLKPILSIKSLAYRLLTTNGVKFLSGWMLDKGTLANVVPELDSLKMRFDDAVRDFIGQYTTATRDWAAQFPEWESVILSALPSEDELATRRFRFAYQIFTVVADDRYADNPGNSLAEETEALPSTAMQEMADAIGSFVSNTFGATREKFSDRTLNGLSVLADQAKKRAFLNPDLGGLSAFLDDLHTAYMGMGQDPASVMSLRLALQQLSSPTMLAHASAEYAASQDCDFVLQSIGAPMNQTLPTPPDAVILQPEPESEPAPAQPAPEPASVQNITDVLGMAQNVLDRLQPVHTAEPATEPAPAPVHEPMRTETLLADWGLI